MDALVTMYRVNERWSQCKATCQRFMDRVMDTKPAIEPTNPKARLWHERAKCSRFDYLSPFLGFAFYFVDVVLDSLVAYEHYNAGDYIWCALSALIIIIPSCIVNGIFAIRLHDDETRDDRRLKVKWMEDHLDIKTTKLTYILHVLQLGPVVRSFRIFKTVHKVRHLDEEILDKDIEMNKKIKIRIQRLLIDQQLDFSLLEVFVAFLEDAPQLLLQLYILVLNKHFNWTFHDILLVLNIIKSVVFFSCSLMNYSKYLHLSCLQTSPLPKCACIGLFVWQFFVLLCRVTALVLFASVFKTWMFLLIEVHFVVFFVFQFQQECQYFKDSQLKVFFFKLAITYVHVFCFFPLEGSDTRKFGFPYYAFTFTENVIITFVWCLYTDYGMVFMIVAVSVEGVAFVIGLLAMALYYRLPWCCHPSRPPPLHASRPNDTTDSPLLFPLLFESTV